VATDNSGQSESEASANTSQKVVTLSTPMSIGTLRDPQKRFPDITEQGTELTDAEASAAQEVAKQLQFKFMKRKSVGGEIIP